MAQSEAGEVRFRRELIRVRCVDYGIGDPHEDAVVIATIRSLNPRREFPFPITSVEDWDLRGRIGRGTMLIAEVNLRSQDADQLKMRNFELAPPPVPEDQLS